MQEALQASIDAAQKEAQAMELANTALDDDLAERAHLLRQCDRALDEALQHVAAIMELHRTQHHAE